MYLFFKLIYYNYLYIDRIKSLPVPVRLNLSEYETDFDTAFMIRESNSKEKFNYILPTYLNKKNFKDL